MSTRTTSIDLERAGAAVPQSASLPLTRDIRPVYASSLLIALVMTITSVVGLLFQSDIYPTDELALAFAPVDVFHLVVGLPILLGSMWLARRGQLVGLLCWPGALLYMLYSFVLNLVGMPFDVLFLPYLLQVILSAHTLIALVASIDSQAVRQKLSGRVPEKSAGGLLMVLTGLFVLNVVSETTTALINETPIGLLDSMLWIADSTTLSPVLIVGGYLLWRRKALGYVGGAGMLLAYIMLFSGLAPVFIFPAFYDASPVDVGGIVFALVMSVLCLVPFVRFVRAIVSERGSSPA